MVDMHTHVLHNIDDGPATLKESVHLLEALEKSGVTDVVATSHCYSESTPIDEFFSRNTRRLAELRKALTESGINVNVHFGAEVNIDQTLLNYNSLNDLCFENTNYILLEIPQTFFKEEAFRLLDKVASYYLLKPIIAHVERYDYLRNAKALVKLKEMGCITQLDAHCVLGRSICNKNFAFKMIRLGLIDVIASDCHDLELRKPNIDLAYNVIEKKLGKETVLKLKENALKLIGK